MDNHIQEYPAQQAPVDLIDFPVSDAWRDHYAAQGLTYPSGRRPKVQRIDLGEIDRGIASLVDAVRQLTDDIRRMRPIERQDFGLVERPNGSRGSQSPVLCKVQE